MPDRAPLGSESTLSVRARRGVAWAASGELARQLNRLVIGIILARVLVPADFGLVAMALFVVDFIAVLAASGLTQAVIQREEVSPADWSSIYWSGLGLGALVASAAWLAAPAAAAFYGEPRIIPIIRVAAWGALLTAGGVTQSAWFAKRLEFRTIAQVELSGALASSLISVAMALSGWGVWSLVTGSLTSHAVTSLLFHARCPWKPGLALQLSTLRWAMRFGAGLQGFGVLNYLNRRLDDAIIGRYVGPIGLGYYTRAYHLMLLPVTSVAGAVGRAVFPALSEIGQDLPRLRGAYLRGVSGIAAVTFPLMLGLLVTAPEAILVVYGERWMPVVPVLQVLCVVGLLQSVVTTVGWIYLAQARTDLMFLWGVGASIVIIASFLAGVRWGILGVATAYGLAYLVLLLPALLIPFRLVGLRLGDLLRAIRGTLAGAALMAAIAAALRFGLLSAGLPAAVVLAVTVAVGVCSYLAWLALTGSQTLAEARLAWSRLMVGRRGEPRE